MRIERQEEVALAIRGRHLLRPVVVAVQRSILAARPPQEPVDRGRHLGLAAAAYTKCSFKCF